VNTASDLQAAEARDAQARATVNNLQAVIAKKVIRAPFDGRVGIRAVELGQVIAPGTPIVSLQTVSPILVEFQLPQQALAEIQVGQKVQLEVDVFPKEKWGGTVSVINPQIDPATRTVRMRATVENPDGRLKPGMFASVEIQTGAEAKALVIPQTAVVYAPYGDSVFVIQKDKANQRFIRLGERRGDFVAVTSGLTLGETVVSNGAFKLHNGQSVVVNNKIAPTPKLNPQPVEE
jgi:membrane fusion protein (multidrug efflux system)